MHRSFGALSAVVLSALLLSACARNPFEVTIDRCPALASAAGTNTLTFFAGSEKRQKDEIATVTITELRRQCRQRSKEITGTATFTISARGGPKLSDDSITVRYFAAVIRDNSRIVSKAVYETRLDFNDQGRGAVEETVRVDMGNVDAARRYDYELLVGLIGTTGEHSYTLLR